MNGLLHKEEKLNLLVSKIANIIQNNFEVGFKFLTIEQWDYIAENRIVNENDIYLPITDEHHLLGVAHIIEGKSLDADQIIQLNELISSIFSGALAMLSHIDELESEETRILETHSDKREEMPSNVVQLSQFKKQKAKVIEDEANAELPQGDVTVFVHAQTADQIFKIAHEIYTKTKRFAFLDVTNFSDKEFTPELLTTLGNICLFVPEVTALTPKQTQTIENYLLGRRVDPNEGVLIVCGSIHSSAELVRSLDFSIDFYRLISQVRLNHLEETLTHEQLAQYADVVNNAHRDLMMIMLLNQLGVTSLSVDNPI